MFDHFIHEDLARAPCLHNHYTLMRHGRARSNVESVLAATHDPRFSLTDEGKESVRQAAAVMFPHPQVVVASDTPRGAETGNVIYDSLPYHPLLRFDLRLRERHWGDHEGTAENNCFAVYAHDRRNLTSHPDNAEPVAAMAWRLSSLIVDLESEFKNHQILLVSHCDPIQVMQAIFTGKNISHYIDMPEFKCAEFRPLVFTPRKTAAEAAVVSSLIGARGDARLAALEL